MSGLRSNGARNKGGGEWEEKGLNVLGEDFCTIEGSGGGRPEVRDRV